MNRMNWNDYFLSIAALACDRGTCPRRKVGCVVVNVQHHILGTGYNGNAPGQPHCIDNPCPGANDKHGDTSRCQAIHAEINAIRNSIDMTGVVAAYITDSPCVKCAQAMVDWFPNLLNVYYLRPYTQEGIDVLENNGVSCWHHKLEPGSKAEKICQLLNILP